MIEEIKIVWLEDPKNFTYLREAIACTTRRKGKIGLGGSEFAKLVGYEELPKQGQGIQVYHRRFWWLKKHDWDICHGKSLGEIYYRDIRELGRDNPYIPNGLYPYEAVFPDSISTKTKSIPFNWFKLNNSQDMKLNND